MAKDIFYTALDIGTSKVATVVAQVGPDGELKIVGTGLVPSQGVVKGQIVNVAEAQEAVQASLNEAQRYMGYRIPWTYVSIAGASTACFNTTGVIHADTNGDAITGENVEQLVQSSYPQIPEDKQLLHVMPVNYVVDGYRGVRSPLGLHAGRVEVESHVVMADRDAIRQTLHAVEDCNVPVRDVVLSSLASAEATLFQDEKEMGVVLADIGAGTTDLAIFKDGSLWFDTSIPVGGNQLTRDLSVALGMPYYFAEDLKDKWGHASPDIEQAGEEVLLPSFQGQSRRLIRRSTLCKPLIDRLQETLGLIMLRAQQAGLRRLPPGGVVLTGGTSRIPGFQQMATETLACPVRVAAPIGIRGFSPEHNQHAFSTVIGLLLWGIKHQNRTGVFNKSRAQYGPSRGSNALFQRIKKAVKVK